MKRRTKRWHLKQAKQVILGDKAGIEEWARLLELLGGAELSSTERPMATLDDESEST